MESLVKFLQSIHPLSEGLLQFLTENVKEKKLAKKEYLLKAGHVSQKMCFITKGLLRCYYLKDDKEVCTWFMKDGDVIVSINSFFLQEPSNEYIQALEDCEVFYISHKEYVFLCKTYLEFNFIARELLQKYYVLWNDLLVGIRMQQASERYDWLLNTHPDMVLRLPAKYLASYLGINEVTLSKIKGKPKFS